MKTQTKQQLRDEIVTLTMRNKTHEIRERQHTDSARAWKAVADLDQHRVDKYKTEAKRATIAAYALLVTLFVIVGVGVIW